jgi:hypothetical protein
MPRCFLATVAMAFVVSPSAPCWGGPTFADCESSELCLAADSVEGAPGSAVVIAVRSVVDQHDATVVQSDLIVPNVVRISAQADDTPACAVDAGIRHPYATFAFLPPGCAPELGCVAVQALVASDAALGSPQLLYRCDARIAPEATPGRYPLQLTHVAAWTDAYPVWAINDGVCDPTSPAYALLGVDGEVSVLGPPGSTPLPTSTPVPTRTATPTKTPCAVCPAVMVGSVTAVPGEVVTIGVTFRGGAGAAVGVQADIAFDPTTLVTRCMMNPSLNKGSGGFSVGPNRVRALVFGFDLDALIPDGALLFTCTIVVAGEAPPGVYPLNVTNVLGSTAIGQVVPMAAEGGQVVVIERPGATPISTPDGAASGLSVGAAASGCALRLAGDDVHVALQLVAVLPWLWLARRRWLRRASGHANRPTGRAPARAG